MTTTQEVFTRTEVEGLLEQAGLDESTITTMLGNFLKVREQTDKEGELPNLLIEFAAAFQRTESGNDSDVEGWFERSEDAAWALLEASFTADEIPEAIKDDIRDSRLLSAKMIAIFAIQKGDDLEERLMNLAEVGVEYDDFTRRLQDAMNKLDFKALGHNLEGLDSDSLTALYRHTVSEPGLALVSRLRSSGYAIPSLNSYGTYPEEESEL